MVSYDEFLNFDLIASVKFIESEFGGRNSPVFDGYKGQFFWHINDVKSTDWDAAYIFSSGQVGPGEKVKCKIVLSENLKNVANGIFEENRQFCIREGSRVVAVGVILQNNVEIRN